MFKYEKYVTHSNENMGGEICDAYATEDISRADVQIEGTKLADHAFVMRVMGHLLGKVLTTVEATTASEKQAKAIKDLMRGHFSEEMQFIGDMMYDQQALNAAAEESLENVPDDEIKSVEIDEVLGVK